MNDLDEGFSPEFAVPYEEPLEVLPVEPARKGQPIIAWAVIALVVCSILGLHAYQAWRESRLVEQGPVRVDERSLVLLRVQARYFVGAAQILKGASKELYPQARGLNTGSIDQRLAFITLAGELAGPKEAENEIESLETYLQQSGKQPTFEEARLKDIMDALYSDHAKGRFDAPSVSLEDRAFLRDRLGWFGELALAPAGSPDHAAREAVINPAIRTFAVLIGTVFTVGFIALLGFVALILFLIMLFSGTLKTGVHCGSTYGSVYAETFALYLFTYFGLTAAVQFIPSLDEWHLPLAGGAALFSLLVLAWPVLRGIPWQQVRQDIGLTAGRQPPLEPFVGVAGYAMTLPLLAVGVVVMLILMFLTGALNGILGAHDKLNADTGLPIHPIVFALVKPDWWTRLQVFVLACVIAPIVEETMFRGVLYRHLREASCRWGFFLSVTVSALVVSFVFAVIHPQGVIAVPALMALAFGFNLVREWRGTLIPGMVAHGINNGLVLTIVILAFGD
jgi:membrane protease YdiL (CAAX protease family)